MTEQLPKYISEENGQLWFTEEDRGNMKFSYRVSKILAVEQSPFQHVMLLDMADFGPSLVLDGCMQSTSLCGHIYNEMIVHIPMHSHPSPKKVLIIGGGDCGAAREALKYPDAEIDMVEIDEAVVRLSKEFMPAISAGTEDPRLKILFEDGFAFVRRSHHAYDVIVVDSSDPEGPAEGLFTAEFYGKLKDALKPDGIMACMSESPVLYTKALKGTRKCLSSVFKIVQTYWFATLDYPGGTFSLTYSSDVHKPLSREVPFDKETRYINKGILDSCFDLPPYIEELLK